MNCKACNKPIDQDEHGECDNILYVGFFGGYGEFVDNIEAKFPVNGEDRWKRGEDGEYIVVDGEPVEDPDWEPEYLEPQIIPGADYAAVICHECAHQLCELVPWIDQLIDPAHSHSHRVGSVPSDHIGWDMHNCCAEHAE